jgi:cell division protein FtsZ
MIKAGVSNVQFCALNTDAQVLKSSKAKNTIQIGGKLTNGLGAGGNPEKGRKAAEESREDIIKTIGKPDIVFITAGLGGGTGTGAAPVVAEIAKESGALTIGIVTIPFSFEGQKRMQAAVQSLEELKENVDALVVIPNDKILEVVERESTMKEAFHVVDEVILRCIQGITDIITIPGLINIELEEIKQVMKNSGYSAIGSCSANSAYKAAKSAIAFIPQNIDKVSGVIINVTGSMDMTLIDAYEAFQVISEILPKSAIVHFGAVIDEKMLKDEIRVTIIATGFTDPGNYIKDLTERNFR